MLKNNQISELLQVNQLNQLNLNNINIFPQIMNQQKITNLDITTNKFDNKDSMKDINVYSNCNINVNEFNNFNNIFFQNSNCETQTSIQNTSLKETKINGNTGSNESKNIFKDIENNNNNFKELTNKVDLEIIEDVTNNQLKDV